MTNESIIQHIKMRPSNPWVGFMGMLFSVLGVIIAIYAIFSSKSHPELTYYVYPLKTSVIKAGEASSLKVYYFNKQISTEVTSIQLGVWNNGGSPIRKGDLLTSINIESNPKIQILETRIVKQTRDVVGFHFSDSEFNSGKVPISWDILEKDDGALIQIVYSGTPEIQFKVGGAIVGQKHISSVELSGLAKWLFFNIKGKSTINKWTVRGLNFVIGLAFILCSAGWFLLQVIKFLIRKPIDKGDLITHIVMYGVFAVFGAGMIIYASQIPQPPF